MELQYMQGLLDHPNLSSKLPLEGLSIEIIINIREEFNQGNIFPKAFEEYLEVGGKSEATGMVWESDDFKELSEDCEEALENCGFKVDRPFFVFDALDSQFSIFYLDEDKEDPDVYILDPYGRFEGHEPLVRNVNYTFSKMINDAIYRKKNNIPL